jgi:hypothetical protein
MMREEIKEIEHYAPPNTSAWLVLKDYVSYMEEKGNELRSHHRQRSDEQCLSIVEFMEAISAPSESQVIQLEWMMQDTEELSDQP